MLEKGKWCQLANFLGGTQSVRFWLISINDKSRGSRSGVRNFLRSNVHGQFWLSLNYVGHSAQFRKDKRVQLRCGIVYNISYLHTITFLYTYVHTNFYVHTTVD